MWRQQNVQASLPLQCLAPSSCMQFACGCYTVCKFAAAIGSLHLKGVQMNLHLGWFMSSYVFLTIVAVHCRGLPENVGTLQLRTLPVQGI